DGAGRRERARPGPRPPGAARQPQAPGAGGLGLSRRPAARTRRDSRRGAGRCRNRYPASVNPLKFDIDKETARGRPTNGAVLAHTHDEFLFDFVQAMPCQQPVVTARLVTSPRHAKALLRSLEYKIRRYEARFGPIPEPPKRAAQPGVGSVDDGEDAN